ncbi:DUF58 domain-containing protein [Propionibacterium freudenreichii]|uniref:DUF58 domain-containing protein n=1 Tax=Propionibacterium freudenreichii TaxID=1744 RepID=UPI000541B6B8|nr:DUF58 domain-containing protein [Propionibacterium freudenreichii]MDK9352894.1 DUF58 domain-containing protein [Propionibacterium freudenreichii]CEH09163.1 Putative uncharacterized protein [Propionibacterium freudenreichii]
MALLTRIKTSLTIPAQRRVAGLLDGAYASIHAGRSLDFADLRAYVPGDDVKDIDWNATARGDEVLVKRYVGDRKHTIMVGVASGRGMAAAAGLDPEGQLRSVGDVAITVAGLLGWLALGHGDYGCVASLGSEGVFLPRPSVRETDLERMLVAVQRSCTPRGADTQLDQLASVLVGATRRRTVMFLVTGDVTLDRATLALLRRLAVQHQLVHLVIGELDPTAVGSAQRSPKAHTGHPHALDDGLALPDFVGDDAELAAEYARQESTRRQRRRHALERLGVLTAQIDPGVPVVGQVLAVLERMRRGANG